MLHLMYRRKRPTIAEANAPMAFLFQSGVLGGASLSVHVRHYDDSMDRLEKIAALDSEVQAELVDAILSDRGIPHIMRTYHDSVYDGIFQTSMGWGHIEAPQSFRDEILAVIADVKRQASSSAATPENPEEGKG
jgi:hypothetical protein